MWWLQNARLVSSILMMVVVSMSDGFHTLEKRQIGVLARSGALPQGKRSVEALARNGELPVASNDKRDSGEEYILDLLIRELGTAEGLSRLRMEALAEKLQNEREESFGKRSLAALARNSDLPQKRRSGYVIEASDEEPDLLDPDEFLGKSGVDVLDVNGGFNVADGSLASFAKHGYGDDEDDVNYYEDDERELEDKRNIGAARNFFSDGKNTIGSRRGLLSYDNRGKKNLASFRNFSGKRSLGSAINFGKRNIGAARNFMFSEKRNIGALKNFISNDKRHLGAAKNYLLGEGKRNVGAARNFLFPGKRHLGAAKDFLYGKRNLASFARDGGFTDLKYPMAKDYDWDDFFDFDDVRDQEEKRHVGAFKNFGKRSVDPVGKSENGTRKEMPKPEDNKTRNKREAYPETPTDEYPMPVLQATRGFDYGDSEEPYDAEIQKRFLGSIASLPEDEDGNEEADIGVSKRHIGALARLGWLPSFRATRYSRSGRAIDYRNLAPFRLDQVSSLVELVSETASASR